MEDIKLTVRMEEGLHDDMTGLARKNHRSLNGEITHTLRHKHWTDNDLVDFANEVLKLPENPPYVLENKDLRIQKALDDFKRRRV